MIGRGSQGCRARVLIDNLLVRIHFILVMIRWTGLAPWEFEFPFPGRMHLPSHVGNVQNNPARSPLSRLGICRRDGARPFHLIITMIKWIRTSRVSIKNSVSLAGVPARYPRHLLLLLLFTLVPGPRRSLSLKLSDTRVYEPQIRAHLGTTTHFCEVVVLTMKLALPSHFSESLVGVPQPSTLNPEP